MPKRLWAMVSFSPEGFYRGFASGYSLPAIRQIVFDEVMACRLPMILTDKDIKRVPLKFFESHYWKTSVDPTDMITVAKALRS